MLKQRIMWSLWPSFLAAGLLEVLVFALVDPHDLLWFGAEAPLPREAVYTLAYFVFWFVTALSSAVSVWLAMPTSALADRSEG